MRKRLGVLSVLCVVLAGMLGASVGTSGALISSNPVASDGFPNSCVVSSNYQGNSFTVIVWTGAGYDPDTPNQFAPFSCTTEVAIGCKNGAGVESWTAWMMGPQVSSPTGAYVGASINYNVCSVGSNLSNWSVRKTNIVRASHPPADLYWSSICAERGLWPNWQWQGDNNC